MNARHLAAAKREAETPDLIDTLFLVNKGIPFDVAFCLPPHRRLAWVVILGELSGGSWDWHAGRWKEK
jgi:hypothetical protein